MAGLIDAIGGEMTDATAVCLYAGLVTDTGRFQYEATTPATLRLAARLREHPFDHARLSQALYEDNRAAYLEVLADRDGARAVRAGRRSGVDLRAVVRSRTRGRGPG